MGNLQSRQKKSEATREAILDTALEFLWSNSYRDLTVMALMEQVGSSRPTFYQYFVDIHELLGALLRDLEQEFHEVLQTSWLNDPADPRAELCKTLRMVFKKLYDKGPVVRATIEAAPIDEALGKAWGAFLAGFDEVATAAIQRDRAAGLALDFDAIAVAQALNRMNVGYACHHFGQRPRTHYQKVLPAVTHVWVSTIYGID